MTSSRSGTSTARLTGQLCLIELIAWGVLYYSFSAYVLAMENELGWSSATVAAGFSVGLLVSGLASPMVGAWIDRHGSRGLMISAATVGGVGVVLWSLAFTLPVYLAAWTLIGTAMAGMLYPPAFATVIRFDPDKSRNAILVITLVGALAAPVFLPAASLLSDWFGWRTGLQILALLLIVVVGPLGAMLPGVATTNANTSPVTNNGRGTPGSFWSFTGALMLVDLATVAVTVHLVVFLIEQGQPAHAAAAIAGLAGLAKIGGRLSTVVGGRFSAMTLLRCWIFATSVALVIPQIWPTTWAAVTMVIGFGAGSGARTVLRPAVLFEIYGSRHFGASNGCLHLFVTLARACGAVGFGMLVGAAGWAGAWETLAGIFAISGGLLCFIHPSTKQSRPSP